MTFTNEHSVIALGTFDGVHLGHQFIIAHLLEIAQKENLKPIIVSFFPHPSHVLTPKTPLKLINSLEERIKLIEKAGVKHVFVQEFSKKFSELSATDFVMEVLIKTLHMKSLIVGHDHSFGKNKEGDFTFLQTLAKSSGFEVTQIAPYYKDEVLISSTLIRQLIHSGSMDKVYEYLSYPFCLFGKVVQGNQLGRKIGFHTANIALDYTNKIIPKKGVYVVHTHIDKKLYYGMMNIGNRPTIDGKTETIEAHFFDLDQDLYFHKLKVKVLYRLRDELKFDSLEQLKAQLKQDKINALAYIKNNL